MGTRDSVKGSHERAVADQLRHGDPGKREPDVIYCKPCEKTLGIEVVTAYYEDSDARDAAEIAAGEKPLGPGEIRQRSGGLLV
jgi:hypothetical protein